LSFVYVVLQIESERVGTAPLELRRESARPSKDLQAETLLW
jgi:hypothetical protein